MTLNEIIVLIVIFFVTSLVGVVTGSNSLISVPAMFQFGIEPRVAVATNMFGLVFMAIGGTIPFVRQGKVDFKKLTPLILLTVVSSAMGAALVGVITNEVIKLIVSIAMIAVVLFTLVRGRSTSGETVVSRQAVYLTYGVTFALGIYGGLYSGGYVTILTATLVAFFGMSYSESVGSTKAINVFSSSIAAAIFAWQGLIDYWVGAILGITMFIGGYVGAHYASKMNDFWLRQIFLATVFLLAVVTLYDLFR